MRAPTLSELPPPPTGKTEWPWIEETPRVSEAMLDGNSSPRVTVVTPSFNQGQFLEETIRSVLLQGYPNLEYIIIDGGSTDESVEIIRKYEKWLTHWVSEKDRGQAHAINKGFTHSTGDICAYLNSDDAYHKGSIREAAQYFVRHPECYLAYAGVDTVDEQRRFISHDEAAPFDFQRFLANNLIAQPSAFFTRNAFERAGRMDESLHFCMDYDLWLRIATLGSCQNVKSCWSQFRLHPSSKTSVLQARRWLETVHILTNWFNSQDISTQHRLCRSEILGRAHWITALELYRTAKKDEAIEQINQGIRENPLFIRSRELVFMLVGDIAARVTEKTLIEVEEFFSLVPDSFALKSSAFRQIMARAEALMALNESTDAREARRYAWRALRRDKTWLKNRHIISRALS